MMCYFSPNFILLLLLIQAFLANCCIEHERDALLEFKAGVNDKSSRLVSWRGEKCCNWVGIRCNNRTSRVVKLNLRNTNVEPWKYHPGLTGKISPSLLFLSDLKHLDLSFNNFSGNKFPEFISAFRNLKYLNLSNTGLSGMIHPELGNLSKSLYFDLRQDYYFSDFILSADTWWLSNMRSLKYIDMSGVDFKDSNNWVQTLNKLSSLEVLVFSGNNLNGTIPTDIGNLTNLVQLDLRDNNLNGTIPTDIGNLTNLVQLDVSGNSLTGLLSKTHLTGLSKLKYLGLADTNITILFGSEWTPSFQLNTIWLRSNKQGPKFPSWIRRQVQIEYLDLTDTGIDDCIPDWVWSLSSLRYLWLPTNILRGKLPASLVHMTKLKVLHLNNNRLVGKIPFLPTSLMYLDLSNNSLSGQLRKNFKSPYKNKSNVLNNHPAEVVELIPCGLTNLRLLELSSNSLSGHLPPCWSNISGIVKLANNRLSGVVPSSLSCSVELVAVQLENNSLTGEFPFDLQFCKGLQLLDLGENNFHGIIPDWVGESFPHMAFLILRSNLFSGNIPSELTQLNNLQFLDLANNYLSGQLPRGLDNFTRMSDQLSFLSLNIYLGENLIAMTKGLKLEYDYDTSGFLLWKSMDLSNNNLIGEIPREIVVLAGLLNLNLSNNHLIGNIPFEIGNMTSLESLDFHMNNLSGTIPQSMSALYSLEVLNFSYNNLSGSIPTGHQLQALDDPSIYSGNPYLCGPPLKTSCGSSETLLQSDGHHDSNSKNIGDRDKWLYLFIEFGFVAGFLVVFFILLFKVKWRYTYFPMVDIVFDRLYVLMLKPKLKWASAH
ncbi:receptor-like protein EIX2 [Carex rostrata]